MDTNRRRLLGNASFLYYLSGRTVSSFGSAFGVLAVTFAVLDTGGSASELGVVLGASALPAALFMLIGGVTGDRVERRLILVGTDVVMAATQGVAAFLFISGSLGIMTMAGLQFVRGFANAFFYPASSGFLPDLVSDHDLQPANALISIGRNASNIVGPSLAGLVIAVTDPGVGLAVDAATYAVSALLLLRVPKSTGAITVGKRLREDLVAGWREVTSRPWVWQMIISFAVYQATVLPAIFLVGPALMDESGGGAAGWAIVMSSRAVGSLLAGVVLLRWRPSRPLLAATLVVLLDVPFLVGLASGLEVWLLTGLAILSACGVIASDTLWQSALQRSIPKDAISRVSSYDGLGSLAMNPLGYVLVGVTASSLGYTNVLLAIVAIHIATHLALVTRHQIRALGSATRRSRGQDQSQSDSAAFEESPTVT